jgi:VanZ family protein
LKRLIISFSLSLSWLFLTTYLLVMPSNRECFMQLINRWKLEKCLADLEADKIVHVGLFFVLVALWCWAVAELKISYLSKFLSFIIVAQTWFFYGIAMEFVQEYLQNGRSYDVKDMIADGIGCGLALLASLPFIRRKQTADPL